MSAKLPTSGKKGGNVESTVTSLNERILRDCHKLYTDTNDGIITIANDLGLKLLPPRKKIIIMLIGNHSAGKSSFINWYVEEHIQRTGVAIETQGFTFVTSGKKRESLTGNATLHLYPDFEALRNIDGVVEYLTTEISTSKQKKFPLVTFVDTPGLVDGDMKYPFDVNNAILWMGNHADLIFVFFDPIGQALCKRTLNLVEKLNERHSDKIRFYLAKADEAGHENDRQRVMMQIVQELCKRPGLNKTCFDMPTIYIPNPNRPSRCSNQIEEVCKDVEKTINQTIQNTLNRLEKDSDVVTELIDAALEKDIECKRRNWQARIRRCGFGLAGLMPPAIFALAFLLSAVPRDLMLRSVGPNITDVVHVYLLPVHQIWTMIPDEYFWYFVATLSLLTVTFMIIAQYCTRTRPTLSRQRKFQLTEHRQLIKQVVMKKKQALYREYLSQASGEHDLHEPDAW